MNQEQSALVRSNYDALPREAKKTKDTTFDRIYKYYHNDKTRIELTPEESAVRERWEKAWLLLCRQRTSKQVVDLLMKLYNVSQSIAYEDVRKAMMLFSNPKDDLKDAKRAIAESMALKGADKCWKTGDMDGYHKFLKIYQDLNRLDQEQGGDIADMLKKLKPHQVIIVSNMEELDKQANKLMEGLAEDIEYTVVNE
jgi:flagellin-specific chaperone FliS